MASPEQLSGKICREYLRRFPKSAKQTLAKKIYKENPTVFTNVETVRSQIRRITGASGAKHRKKTTNKEFFKVTKHHNPFDLPEPIVLPEIQDYYFPFETCNKGLLIADLHIPFHNNPAIVTALEFGLKKRVNFIIILGDLNDHYQQSPFMKDPRHRFYAEELEMTIQFLRELRKIFPGCQIFLKKGNHDEWYDRYLMKKAPELLDVDHFDYETVYQLEKNHIRLIGDKQIIKAGKLNLLHGHEWRYTGNPVNAARGSFLKGNANAIVGHHHRTSVHTDPNLNGELIATWSLGCLCQLRPVYDVPKWNHGCAYVEFESDGTFSVENRWIHKGKLL